MIGQHAVHSSQSDEWETPQSLFDRLHAEFGFTSDVCATATNAKHECYFDKRIDALRWQWDGVCWMNPPYSQIGAWMAKAREEAVTGHATVVCLVPARTDTRWWHDNCVYADEIRFVRGRIKFGGSRFNAPFPSAIVIFRKLEAPNEHPL